MFKKWWLVVFFTLTMNAYAEDASTIQGAEQYNWESCVNNKVGECLNGCATSEELDCKQQCEEMSKDKCQTMGLKPTE